MGGAGDAASLQRSPEHLWLARRLHLVDSSVASVHLKDVACPNPACTASALPRLRLEEREMSDYECRGGGEGGEGVPGGRGECVGGGEGGVQGKG